MQWTPQVIISLAAVLIALISLGIVIYKEFIANYKLEVSIDQVCILRLLAENKATLLLEILTDDLLSAQPSPAAAQLLSRVPTIAGAVRSRDRQRIGVEAVAYSRTQSLTYDPPQALVGPYLSDKRFAVPFYIPLLVTNSGRRHAHVSELVLVVTRKGDSSAKWAFCCFLEADPKAIVHRTPQQKDADIMSDLFAGFAVPPADTVRVDPIFTPITTAEDCTISADTILPGSYEMRVFLYSSAGKKMFATAKAEHTITQKQLLDSFMSAESIAYLATEKCVIDAIRSRG